MPRASVLLADDNLAILELVARMLARTDNYEIVAALTDGSAVMREVFLLKPDVVILDISMGELNGIEVARDLRDSGCQSKVVFLTVHEDADFLNAAMNVGGSGYVVKSRLSTDLVSAIDAVLSGKVFVSQTLLYQPHSSMKWPSKT